MTTYLPHPSFWTERTNVSAAAAEGPVEVGSHIRVVDGEHAGAHGTIQHVSGHLVHVRVGDPEAWARYDAMIWRHYAEMFR